MTTPDPEFHIAAAVRSLESANRKRLRPEDHIQAAIAHAAIAQAAIDLEQSYPDGPIQLASEDPS